MVFVPTQPIVIENPAGEPGPANLPPIGASPRGTPRATPGTGFGTPRNPFPGTPTTGTPRGRRSGKRGAKTERRFFRVLAPAEVPLSARLATFHAGENVEFIPGSPLIRLRTSKRLLEEGCATFSRIEKLSQCESGPSGRHRVSQLERRLLRPIQCAIEDRTTKCLLSKHHRDILQAFSTYVADDQGRIAEEDFVHGLRELDVMLNLGISLEEEKKLLTALDPSQSRLVPFNVFVNAFAAKKNDHLIWDAAPPVQRNPFGIAAHQRKSFRKHVKPKAARQRGGEDTEASIAASMGRIGAAEAEVKATEALILKKQSGRRMMLEMEEMSQVHALDAEIIRLEAILLQQIKDARPTRFVSLDPLRPWRITKAIA